MEMCKTARGVGNIFRRKYQGAGGLHVHVPAPRVIDAGQLGISTVWGESPQAQTLVLVMGRQLVPPKW